MCNIPGSGNYKRMNRDGKIYYKYTSTGEELENPPILSADLLADFRILEHLIGLKKICQRTGFTVLATKSIFSNRSIGGRIDKIKYDRFIQLRTEVYKQYDWKVLENMRYDFITHPTFQTKSRKHIKKYKRPKESIELLKLARKDKKFNVIEPGISDSFNNRPNGSGHRYLYTEDIYHKLKTKCNNIGIDNLQLKINYSKRHIHNLLKQSHIGKLLDPYKGKALIQYANSIEDL